MFCFHKYKFKGGGYLEYTPKFNNHGVVTFDVYKCEKCGKVKVKKVDKRSLTYSGDLIDYILRLETYGYRPLNEYRIK